MTGPHWLLRIALRARKPPDRRRAILASGTILLCVALFLIERFVGWPQAFSISGPWGPKP
ncbi:MAG: hypothetical protein AAF982_10805 [Pseudomonadota bacterium]